MFLRGNNEPHKQIGNPMKNYKNYKAIKNINQLRDVREANYCDHLPGYYQVLKYARGNSAKFALALSILRRG